MLLRFQGKKFPFDSATTPVPLSGNKSLFAWQRAWCPSEIGCKNTNIFYIGGIFFLLRRGLRAGSKYISLLQCILNFC